MRIALVSLTSNGPKTMKSMRGMTSDAVVAWLTPIDGAVAPATEGAATQTYRLVQKNKMFAPHLLVVPTGSSIDFPNEDPFFHNVFSLFNGKRFDLGLYEAGRHRAVRFDREGVSYIFCNIHPAMGAVVVSLATPFYAVSDASGSITLGNVPPGTYALKLWSEGVSAQDLTAMERKIKVTGAPVQLGTITLPISQALAAHKNKFGEEYQPTVDKPY